MKALFTLLIVAIILSFGLVLNSIFSLMGSIAICVVIVYFTWRKHPLDKR